MAIADFTDINIGSAANDRTGDKPRTVGLKINSAWIKLRGLFVNFTAGSPWRFLGISNSADKLQTARNINDVAFDGTQNITISKLYKPDGSSYTVYVDANGALNVNGDIIQTGEPYIVYAEEVRSKDDVIIMRDGAISELPPNTYSGLRIKIYDGVNDLLLVAGNDGWGRIGEENSLQIIATREDAPFANSIAFWNDTAKRFDTNEYLTVYGASILTNSVNRGTILSPVYEILAMYSDKEGTLNTSYSGIQAKNSYSEELGSGIEIFVTNSAGELKTPAKFLKNGNTEFEGQIISTVTTGTSPLSVVSTTLVTNLNADKVDGYDVQPGAYDSGTYILRNNSYGIGQTGTLTTITQAQLDDYTFGANGAMYVIANPSGLRAGNYHVYIHRTSTINLHQVLKSTNVDTRVYQRYINSASGITAWSQVWDSTSLNLLTIDLNAKILNLNESLKIKGSGTGITTISSGNSSASNYTLTLPAYTGTVTLKEIDNSFVGQTFTGNTNIANNVASTTKLAINNSNSSGGVGIDFTGSGGDGFLAYYSLDNASTDVRDNFILGSYNASYTSFHNGNNGFKWKIGVNTDNTANVATLTTTGLNLESGFKYSENNINLLKTTTYQLNPPGSGNITQIGANNLNQFIVIPGGWTYNFSISFNSDIKKGSKIDMIIITVATGNITLVADNGETFYGDVSAANVLLTTPSKHNRVTIESLTSTGNIFWVTVQPSSV